MPDIEPKDWPTVGPRHGDIGYVSLWVPDVERAADFFAAVLGWRYGAAGGSNGRRVEGRDIDHGLWGGEERSTMFCCFAVADVAGTAERVRAAGGTATEPHPEPFGTVVEGVDDQGIRFAAYQPPGGVGQRRVVPTNGRRHGDVAYVTMEVVDAAKARAFYGNVLGWRFAAGYVVDGWSVDDVAPMVGLSGGHDVATTWAMYRVDDIGAAVDAVRDAGGTATDPEVQPYGVTSNCTDDQGTRFSVGQL